MKEQVMQKRLYTVEVLIHPLTVFQIGILFLFMYENFRNIKITEEGSAKPSPN